jgi:creatinine amidohydrolase
VRVSVHCAELTPREFRVRLAEAPIAYLPLGTLEWHGEHLPLGADGLQAQGFFATLAQEAGGIVLPMLFLAPDMRFELEHGVFYGMDYYGFAETTARQLDGSAYWVPNEFFESLLGYCLAQLARAGFRIVVAHGHGPSTQCLYAHRETWEKEYNLKIFACWRDDESDGLGIQTDHAAANETSLMMALHPHLVHMEYLDPDPAAFPVAIDGADPRIHASPERGQQALSINVKRMSKILRAALHELQKA